MRTGFGVVTSAGFETCAEAMYLGKKLLVIPIRNQYEQACNAAALEQLGVHVIWNIGPDFSSRINQWLTDAPVVSTYRYRRHSRTDRKADSLRRPEVICEEAKGGGGLKMVRKVSPCPKGFLGKGSTVLRLREEGCVCKG
jgi:hypothetical protein